MVRAPYFDKNGKKKGAWSKEEDNKLRAYIERYGHANWRILPELAGLSRCGKSCRLRWVNYLRPTVKRGNFTSEEEELIINLYNNIGTKWSAMATKLPGRSDNEIKNHWHTHLKRRASDKRPVSCSKNEIIQNPKCSKEKGGLKVSDNLEDRMEEVEILLEVLSSDTSSDAHNEQPSLSSSSSLDHGAWNGYSSQPLNEEPVNDFWSLGDEFIMAPMDLVNKNVSSSSSIHDTIMIDDCLWPSMEFPGL